MNEKEEEEEEEDDDIFFDKIYIKKKPPATQSRKRDRDSHKEKFRSSLKHNIENTLRGLKEVQPYRPEDRAEMVSIAHKICDYCFENKKVIFIRNIPIVASAIILVTLCHYQPVIKFLSQTNLIKQFAEKEREEGEEEEKKEIDFDIFKEKVLKLKKKLETCESLNLFNSGIIKHVSEFEVYERKFIECCNLISLPFRVICSIVDVFRKTIKDRLLKGKSRNYVIATVIVHTLSTRKCRCVDNVDSYSLSPETLKLLYENLNIKPKTLNEYEKELYEHCCKKYNL